MRQVSVYVEVSLDCPRCHTAVPVNGLTDRVACGACGHATELEPARWGSLLGENVPEAASMGETEGRTSTVMSDLHMKLKYGRLQARCAQCKNPYPLDYADQLASMGEFACPACGARASARVAPDWAKAAVHPAVRWIFGETLRTGATTPVAEPMRIHCTGCGAPLMADGTARNVPCSHCGSITMLSDPIWHRLNPVAVSTAWFLILELGNAVALLPEDCWTFCDVAFSAEGKFVIAYHADDEGDVGHRARIAGVDGSGMVAWLQDGVDFSDDAILRCSPDGKFLVLIDPERGFVRYLDPETGTPRKTLPALTSYSGDYVPADTLRPLSVESLHGRAVVDFDGSLIVAPWGNGASRPTLMRYAKDGTPVPMWGTAPGRGWFKDPHYERPEWSALGHQPLVPPDDVVLAMGGDGTLVFLDEHARHIARFDRAGQMVERRALQPPPGDVEAFGVDARGVTFILFEHEQLPSGDDWAHLAYVAPGGPFTIWLGPIAPQGGDAIPLRQYDDKMKVRHDGLMFVGHDFRSLRVIDASGRLLWRSPGTIRADEEEAEERAAIPRPPSKRAAEDAGWD